jgi:hypothetical protein
MKTSNIGLITIGYKKLFTGKKSLAETINDRSVNEKKRTFIPPHQQILLS